MLTDLSSQLHIEEEVQYVALLDDVLFSFGADFPFGFSGGHVSVIDEVLVCDGFGADEAFFKVGVDDGGGLGGFHAFGDGPGAGFLGAGGEIGLEAEEVICVADQVLES